MSYNGYIRECQSGQGYQTNGGTEIGFFFFFSVCGVYVNILFFNKMKILTTLYYLFFTSLLKLKGKRYVCSFYQSENTISVFYFYILPSLSLYSSFIFVLLILLYLYWIVVYICTLVYGKRDEMKWK